MTEPKREVGWYAVWETLERPTLCYWTGNGWVYDPGTAYKFEAIHDKGEIVFVGDSNLFCIKKSDQELRSAFCIEVGE